MNWPSCLNGFSCRLSSLNVLFLVGILVWVCPITLSAQPYAHPDRTAPGDEMIQAYLRAETEKLESRFLDGVTTAEEWTKLRPKFKEEYLYMLGLWPLPDKNALEAKITGAIKGDGFKV